MKLEAPAQIEWAHDQLHVGSARLQVAEGRADLEDLRWDAGKLATRGAFEGIPLTALLRIAGLRPPLASTLVIAGDWSVAATPQLNGTVHVRRERGDLFGTEGTGETPNSLALGITTLEAQARFQDDNVAATAMLRSQRAGNADATLRSRPAKVRREVSRSTDPLPRRSSRTCLRCGRCSRGWERWRSSTAAHTWT